MKVPTEEIHAGVFLWLMKDGTIVLSRMTGKAITKSSDPERWAQEGVYDTAKDREFSSLEDVFSHLAEISDEKNDDKD